MKIKTKALASILAVLGVITAIAITLSPAPPPPSNIPDFTDSTESPLVGTWKTRTVADDKLNGAYTGEITFGTDFYEVQNDLVATPVKIERLQYRMDKNSVKFWVEGNEKVPSTVTMLSESTATLKMPGQNNLVLYLYRQN